MQFDLLRCCVSFKSLLQLYKPGLICTSERRCVYTTNVYAHSPFVRAEKFPQRKGTEWSFISPRFGVGGGTRQPSDRTRTCTTQICTTIRDPINTKYGPPLKLLFPTLIAFDLLPSIPDPSLISITSHQRRQEALCSQSSMQRMPTYFKKFMQSCEPESS